MGCSSCNKRKITTQPRMPVNNSRKPAPPRPNRSPSKGNGIISKNVRSTRGKLPTRPRRKLL